jgi:hypothetical protein
VRFARVSQRLAWFCIIRARQKAEAGRQGRARRGPYLGRAGSQGRAEVCVGKSQRYGYEFGHGVYVIYR